jgi:hypothetical protein
MLPDTLSEFDSVKKMIGEKLVEVEWLTEE